MERREDAVFLDLQKRSESKIHKTNGIFQDFTFYVACEISRIWKLLKNYLSFQVFLSSIVCSWMVTYFKLRTPWTLTPKIGYHYSQMIAYKTIQ